AQMSANRTAWSLKKLATGIALPPSQSRAPSVLGAADFVSHGRWRGAVLRAGRPASEPLRRPGELQRGKRPHQLGMNELDVQVRQVQQLREAGSPKDAAAAAADGR